MQVHAPGAERLFPLVINILFSKPGGEMLAGLKPA
jgi:hypothetical protein